MLASNFVHDMQIYIEGAYLYLFVVQFYLYLSFTLGFDRNAIDMKEQFDRAV